MVKTLWTAEDFHGHYPAVALRFFDALRDSPVRFAVSLTGMGSELTGNTGHFQGFHILDQILNRLRDIKLVHLQGGWFMDDLARWADAIAQHDRIGFTLAPTSKRLGFPFRISRLLRPRSSTRRLKSTGP